MGINTNLNISPYFDDFDEQKQFVRVLFKPARAVQARELTTLQSILQNQIERFGNNIFQEGTVIEGINPTTEENVKYIKVNDQAGVTDMTIFASTAANPVFARGMSSNVRAKIVAGANGFQTRDPDLKTLFVKYLVSSPAAAVGGDEQKVFSKGELIQIEDADGAVIVTLTAASLDDYQGDSYAISVTDGVIYQRGLFNFVGEQLIVASKYTNNPNNISVGFDLKETIVDAGLDPSLLDNAQGFNNQNAPGADRLKIEPKLSAYAVGSEPSQFFTLVRLEEGNPVFIRGETQFNSIAKELANRTSETAGSYVADGLEITTEVAADGTLNAVIGAGTAYAFGNRVSVLNNKRIPIEPVQKQSTKASQSTGVSFGGYFEVDVSSLTTLESFDFNTRYNLHDNTGLANAAGNVIGQCSIRNIEPRGDDLVRIYVYAITKESAYTNTPISYIGNASTPVTIENSKVVQANSAAAIFDIGRSGMKAANNVIYVEKKRRKVDVFDPGNPVVTIEAQTNGDVTEVPITSGIFGVSTTGKYVPIATAAPQFVDDVLTQIVVTFNLSDGQPNVDYIYYDASISGVQQDTLQEVDVWVQTTFQFGANLNIASLGLPNVVELKSVLDEDGNDITAKFRLVNNAKDGYYDISFLRLRTGETVPNASQLKINVVALKRTFVGASKFLSPNSYSNITNLTRYINPFTAKNGRVYNPVNCFDYRPYATPTTQYSQNFANPPVVPSSISLSLNPTVSLANDKAIISNHDYFLSRIDKLAIDKDKQFVIVKGQPAENPGKVVNDSFFGIADLFIPGNIISQKGINSVKVQRNTTKNYTMKDIKGIEKRLDTIQEVLSLSMLEQKTKDMFIPDANGLNRFKNGILVEQFKDLKIADILDNEYGASIERGQTILAPKITQFPVDLKVDLTANANPEKAGTKNAETGKLNTVTKALDVTSKLTGQEKATTFRNLASNFYRYNGKLNMTPQFDAEYDVTENPDVTINIDLATPLLDLVDNIQQYLPLTNTTLTGTDTIGDTVREGDWLVTPLQDSFIDDALVGNVQYDGPQDLGTYLTDVSLKPFMASREIRIACHGLRPNTRHYFYFDETPVDNNVAPGGFIENDLLDSLNPAAVSAIGDDGDSVLTDEYGRLFAVFNIPPQKFYVGDAELLVVDVDNFASISSAATSKARSRYHAYNFAMNTTTMGTSTRTVDFDVDYSDVYTQDRQQRVFSPLSCFVAGTIVRLQDGTEKKIEDVQIGDDLIGQDESINKVLEFDHPALGGRDLIGINGSGPWCTPEHPVYTKVGWKAPDMSHTLEAYPHLAEIMVGDLEVGDEIQMEDGSYKLVESIEVHENEPEQQVYNFILDGNNTYFADGMLVHNRDPLSQTFQVQPTQVEFATFMFVPKVDLFFKQKSPADRRNGITVQIRETFNGYPTSQIVNYGSKHIDWERVQTSDDGSLATTVVFDDLVKLETGKDYCITIEPDAIDPDYFVFTAKVGENDLADDSVQVTSDWGFGVLFTSTDNKAWTSYQNEDIKFKIYKQSFSTDTSHVDLIPNNMEFFTISGAVGRFQNDEYAYVETTNVYDGNLTGGKVVTQATDFGPTIGDMVTIKQSAKVHVSVITNLVAPGDGSSTITLKDAPVLTDGSVTITAAIGGRVSFFNPSDPTRLHLKESTSSSAYQYTLNGSQVIRGARSASTARLETIFDAPISYFQPMIMQENTMRTSTDLTLFSKLAEQDVAENNSGDSIAFYGSNYLTGTPRYIPSHQNILSNGSESDRFRFRMNLENNGFKYVTPVVDKALSTMQVYEYTIDEAAESSSSYVSKKVVLQPDYPADGLRVILAGYRPAGTMIDVYARFAYPQAPDDMYAVDGTGSILPWIELTNSAKDLYSTTANIRDYREFEYILDNEQEYDAFQIKIVLRHATNDELAALNLSDTIERAENLFPHVYDYRAIALT